MTALACLLVCSVAHMYADEMRGLPEQSRAEDRRFELVSCPAKLGSQTPDLARLAPSMCSQLSGPLQLLILGCGGLNKNASHRFKYLNA